jgi:2-polyprenyl-3-methyl-5-hydroxy-6-metoxy-1,4-benzoquinol methylase
VLADVLHYMNRSDQKQVIENCLNSLNENGVLIIRDGNAEMRAKHLGTRLTEFFSTRLFSFNKTTQSGLSFLTGNFIHEIALQHRFECSEIDETRYTSNMIFIIKKPTFLVHAAN